MTKATYRIKVEKFGPNCYLADGATWDRAWFTNQDRHPEEKVKIYKNLGACVNRALELQRNGVDAKVVIA